MAAAQFDHDQRQAKPDSGDVQRADDDAGGGADHDDVEDRVTGVPDRQVNVADGQPFSLVAEDHGDRDDHGGRQQGRRLRRPVEPEQRADQDDERQRETPSSFDPLPDRPDVLLGDPPDGLLKLP